MDGCVIVVLIAASWIAMRSRTVANAAARSTSPAAPSQLAPTSVAGSCTSLTATSEPCQRARNTLPKVPEPSASRICSCCGWPCRGMLCVAEPPLRKLLPLRPTV
jgi:hypothetical protein